MKTLEIIDTSYGALRGVTNFNSYPDGQLQTCMLCEENSIETHVGNFIPQYRTEEFGDRQKKHRSALLFHPNGVIKSAALQYATPIQTPLGTFDAELVTFHENGAINRLFPLNGVVNAFWTENQERSLAKYLDFDLPIGKFTAKVIALHFYPGGALKSLTLWPGEIILLRTPIGEMAIRAGFSLYENGAIKSVEPARPTIIHTPLGSIKAFDPDVIGMHADQNSVQFGPSGELLSLKSLATGIVVTTEDGEQRSFEPLVRESQLNSEDTRIIALRLDFRGDEVQITSLETSTFSRDACQFTTFPVEVKLTSGCGGCLENTEGCANCDGSCDAAGCASLTPEGCENCDGSCGDRCVVNRA